MTDTYCPSLSLSPVFSYVSQVTSVSVIALTVQAISPTNTFTSAFTVPNAFPVTFTSVFPVLRPTFGEIDEIFPVTDFLNVTASVMVYSFSLPGAS
jgi:hypothetical protein